jgi:hypothetical protein
VDALIPALRRLGALGVRALAVPLSLAGFVLTKPPAAPPDGRLAGQRPFSLPVPHTKSIQQAWRRYCLHDLDAWADASIAAGDAFAGSVGLAECGSALGAVERLRGVLDLAHDLGVGASRGDHLA